MGQPRDSHGRARRRGLARRLIACDNMPHPGSGPSRIPRPDETRAAVAGAGRLPPGRRPDVRAGRRLRRRGRGPRARRELRRPRSLRARPAPDHRRGRVELTLWIEPELRAGEVTVVVEASCAEVALWADGEPVAVERLDDGTWLLAWAWVGRAEACSTCACGDPTIVTVGTDAPRRGATRVALSSSYRTEREGAGATAMAEARAGLAVAHAPTRWLDLVAELPIVARSLVTPTWRASARWARATSRRPRAAVWRADRAAVGPIVGARLHRAGAAGRRSGRPAGPGPLGGAGGRVGDRRVRHLARLRERHPARRDPGPRRRSAAAHLARHGPAPVAAPRRVGRAGLGRDAAGLGGPAGGPRRAPGGAGVAPRGAPDDVAQAHLVVSAVELVPCAPLARGGPFSALAHTPSTPTRIGVPLVVDLLDEAPRRLGTLRPPPADWCWLDVWLAPADADARRVRDDLGGQRAARPLGARAGCLDPHARGRRGRLARPARLEPAAHRLSATLQEALTRDEGAL